MKILVVEDSATQAEALRALLEEEGYDVSLARSGEEGLDRISGAGFDLVLSDIVMPGIDGYELCRRIKTNPEWRGLPVVLLTSLTDPMDIVRGLEAGADNYITKPYEPEHLLARLRHVRDNLRLRRTYRTSMGVSVSFLGRELTITSDKEQILDLLLSSIEDVIRTNHALEESQRELADAHTRLEAFAREKAEEAHASGERYRTLMQSAADAIFVLDRDERIVEANPRAAELVGRSVADLVGRAIEDLVRPAETATSREAFAEVLEHGTLRSEERTLVHAGGRLVHCEVNASRTSVGGEELVIAIYRDVTERVRTRRELAASEASYRSLFDSLNEAVYILDADGRFLNVNRAVEEMYGHRREEILGETPAMLAAPGRVDLEETAERIRRARAGEPQRFEWWGLRRNGEVFPKEVSLTRGAYFGQEVVIAVARDISESKRVEERLRRSEHQLAEAQHIAQVGSWEWDVADAALHWSDETYRIFGLEPGETAPGYDDFLARVHPDDRERVDTAVRRALAGTEPYDLELRVVRPDGAVRVVHGRAQVMRDEEGAPLRMVGMVQDVTERKAAEQELEDSQQRYRSLFLYSPAAVVSVDLEGRFTSANPACTAISGYQPGELNGTSFAPLVVPEDLEKVSAHFRRALAGGASTYETTILHKEGHRVSVSVTSSPIVVGGEIVGVYGIVEDITERERAQAELRMSEERFRTLIDASPAAIVALDRDARVRLWNSAAECMFGWSSEEAAGRPPPFVPEERQEECGSLVGRVLAGDSLVGVELVRRRKDGSPITVSLSAAPLRGPDGEVTGIMSVIVDTTERRRAEEALRRSEEQLRQVQKMEAVGRLAGGIAHDFNNILTTIKGNAQIALMDLDEDSPLADDLGEIDRAAERASALTRQLLAFSRKEIIRPRVLDLNEVVAGAEKMLSRTLGEDIEFTLDLQPGLGLVEADPGQIEQVLMNLAVNARDAMAYGGRLTLATEDVVLTEAFTRERPFVQPGRYVRLTVRDTGEGMPPEVLESAFEPFFTTKPQGRGTGLGLAMVYGIVKQSGGYVWADSEVGEGTTFEIHLPRTDHEPEPDEADEAAPLPRADAATVLLVEDEAAVRSIARRILERHGYTVLEAQDVDAALALCTERGGEIDLLITDVVMPGMSGRELADRARTLCPSLRVLFMSGYTDEAISQHGVLEPGVEFIHKPFSTEAFARKVGEVLNGE